MKNKPLATIASLIALVTPSDTSAQLSDFLGPHVMETLPYEIPGTGRIGGITVDGYGYLYVANQDEGIWKIHPSGDIELFVDGLYGSASGVMLRNGDLLHSSYGSDQIIRIERDGTVHSFVADGLEGPVGLVVVNDAVYTVNAKSDWIARISMDGSVSEFVRDERLSQPNGITSDRDGNLFVVNLDNTIVLKITQDGDISEIATLPGTANGHVAYVGGALYVTQIWENVVLRVEMDGSYQVVAGDGTRRSRAGASGESRVPFPNGIVASRRGDAVYFNTLEGNMVNGDPGIIRVHKLSLPSPNGVFANAWELGGVDGLRLKFDEAGQLNEASSPQFHDTMYNVGWYFLNRGNVMAGLAMIEWTTEIDENEARAMVQLGRAHLVHGDRDVATRNLEGAVERIPNDSSLKRILDAARTYRRNSP